jgi:sirohydrochlorin ferrochelatase
MADRVGLLLVAHQYGDDAKAHLRDLLDAATDGEAVLGTIGHASLGDVPDGARQLRDKGCTGIVVVPLLTLSASTNAKRLTAGIGAIATELDVALAICGALDDAPEVVDILEDRARALAEGTPPAHAVMLVGHGPSRPVDLAGWEHVGMALANAVHTGGGFAAARAGFVQDDASPDIRAAAVRALRQRIARYAADTGRAVIVVPWLVGSGALSRVQLPEDLAELDIRYDGHPLLPHPALTRWVRRQLDAGRAALAEARVGGVVAVSRS